MSLLSIITTIILLIPAFFLIKTFVSLAVDINGHRKTMNKMKDWSKFHKQLLDWSEEILDQEIKKEYLLHCVSILSNNNNINIEGLKNMDIDKAKDDIIKRFSNHIPSLKQEVRETRINKILN